MDERYVIIAAIFVIVLVLFIKFFGALGPLFTFMLVGTLAFFLLQGDNNRE